MAQWTEEELQALRSEGRITTFYSPVFRSPHEGLDDFVFLPGPHRHLWKRAEELDELTMCVESLDIVSIVDAGVVGFLPMEFVRLEAGVGASSFIPLDRISNGYDLGHALGRPQMGEYGIVWAVPEDLKGQIFDPDEDTGAEEDTFFPLFDQTPVQA